MKFLVEHRGIIAIMVASVWFALVIYYAHISLKRGPRK